MLQVCRNDIRETSCHHEDARVIVCFRHVQLSSNKLNTLKQAGPVTKWCPLQPASKLTLFPKDPIPSTLFLNVMPSPTESQHKVTMSMLSPHRVYFELLHYVPQPPSHNCQTIPSYFPQFWMTTKPLRQSPMGYCPFNLVSTVQCSTCTNGAIYKLTD